MLLIAALIQPVVEAPADVLQTPAGGAAVVLLFTSTDCPISNRYAPEVRRLAKTFSARGVVFRVIYPGHAGSDAALRDHLASFGYADVMEPYRDSRLGIAKKVGATITPEAVVLVRGRVVYRGRIDDRQVDLGVERPSPASHDLADALASALAGRPIAHPVTQAVGCFIADLAR